MPVKVIMRAVGTFLVAAGYMVSVETKSADKLSIIFILSALLIGIILFIISFFKKFKSIVNIKLSQNILGIILAIIGMAIVIFSVNNNLPTFESIGIGIVAAGAVVFMSVPRYNPINIFFTDNLFKKDIFEKFKVKNDKPAEKSNILQEIIEARINHSSHKNNVKISEESNESDNSEKHTRTEDKSYKALHERICSGCKKTSQADEMIFVDGNYYCQECFAEIMRTL